MIKHILQCKCDRCGNVQSFNDENEAAKAGWHQFQYNVPIAVPAGTVLCFECSEAQALLGEAFMKGTEFGLRKNDSMREGRLWYISN